MYIYKLLHMCLVLDTFILDKQKYSQNQATQILFTQMKHIAASCFHVRQPHLNLVKHTIKPN